MIGKQISQLKESYKLARQTRKNQEALLQKREELQDQIDWLKIEIESDKIKGRFEESKVQQLELLQREKHEIDSELDHTEELTDEEIEKLHRELVDTIKREYPQNSKEYDQLSALFVETTNGSRSASDLLETISGIVELIDGILRERQRIRLLGFLSYIFRSPNAMITKAMQKISKLSADGIDLIEGLLRSEENPAVSEGYRSEIEILKSLKAQGENRWGFKQLDEQLPRTLKLQQAFLDFLRERSVNLEREENRLKEELEAWIEQF